MEANYVHKDSTTLVQDELAKNELNQIELQYNTLKQQKFNEVLKENQELKKKLNKANDELYTLKNKYNIRLLNQISENIEPDCEDYYLAEIETKANKYDLIQTQQKEFIKYLEDCIKELEKENFNKLQNVLNLGISDITKEILQKYKSIIGEETNK